jgi:hypothetical protein
MSASTHETAMEPWLAAHSLRGEGFVLQSSDVVPLGERIVGAAEGPVGALPGGAMPPGVPVLDRGAAQIVPLSWTPAGTSAAARTFSATVWSGVRAACEFRHGAAITVSVDAPDTAYAAELARCGVRRADWWASGESALVLVVHGGPLPSPSTAMALHVVPLEWVSERRRWKKMVVPDLAWSREDVA